MVLVLWLFGTLVGVAGLGLAALYWTFLQTSHGWGFLPATGLAIGIITATSLGGFLMFAACRPSAAEKKTVGYIIGGIWLAELLGSASRQRRDILDEIRKR